MVYAKMHVVLLDLPPMVAIMKPGRVNDAYQARQEKDCFPRAQGSFRPLGGTRLDCSGPPKMELESEGFFSPDRVLGTGDRRLGKRNADGGVCRTAHSRNRPVASTPGPRRQTRTYPQVAGDPQSSL